MKYFIYSVVILSVCFSHTLVKAEKKKVVVVPLFRVEHNLAATGQTNCYNENGGLISCYHTGQDGDVRKGMVASPRFVNNWDGTVTDKLTGLIWLREGNCTKFFATDSIKVNERPWQDALEAANKLTSGYCDLTDGSSPGDWRLPNIRELESLVDYGRFHPCIDDTVFPSTMIHSYWSSTSIEAFPHHAWYVSFDTGGIGGYEKLRDENVHVRAVRGGH